MIQGRAPLFVRLAFAGSVLLFLGSLLTVVSASTATLWLIAILFTEWGHYWALAALALAAFVFRRGRVGRAAALLAIVAAVLCLSPAFRAGIIARSLPARCTAAFGDAPPGNGRRVPFSVLDLFRGVPTSGVLVSERTYAKNGTKELKLDFYRSNETKAPRPLIITIHGGAWDRGNKSELPQINRYLAHEGYAVAAINYRLAPKAAFPAPLEDVFRAIDYLKAHAAELQIDPTRIALLGRSAGAQLALSAGYAQRDPAIRAVIDFYGPSDLLLGYNVPSRKWVLDSQQALIQYVPGTPDANPQGYFAASPINFVNAATPPTLIVHGGLDGIVWPRQSQALAEKLSEAHRPYLFLELPWATHGCDANLSGPSGQLSLYAIDRLLAAAFAAP